MDEGKYVGKLEMDEKNFAANNDDDDLFGRVYS